MKHALLFLLALSLSGCALFQVKPPAAEPEPGVNVVARAVDNTVALVNADGRFCTGVFVEGAALTAAHCVDNGPFRIETGDGKQYDVVVAKVDQEHDLAALAIVGKRLRDTVPLAPEAPGLGHKVVWMGYPLGYDFIMGVGVVGNPSIEDGAFMAIYGQLIPGNSGGPVFNQFGELVGIVSATMAVPSGNPFIPQFLPIGYVIHFNHVKSLLDSL